MKQTLYETISLFPIALRSYLILIVRTLFLAKWPKAGMDKDILMMEDLTHSGKRPNLTTVMLRLFRHLKTTWNIPILQQHRRSFSRVVSMTGPHKSVHCCNVETGGYKHIKGIQRWDGEKPTHYNDKQHPDAGTSAHRARHLPLQTATVLSLKAEHHTAGGVSYAGSPVQKHLMSQLVET